jgi:hypothetical protein
MALVENGLRAGTGVAVGIGAIILAPMILPLVSAVVKPVLVAGIKGGMMLYRKTSEILAEASETIEDLVVEAKAEVMAEQSPIVLPALSEGEVNQ